MKPRPPAWTPPAWKTPDCHAFKALARGDATPDQQKRALDWLINAACGTYELSFRSDTHGGDRETAFAEGRRFVGLQVVKMVNMPSVALHALREKDDGTGS